MPGPQIDTHPTVIATLDPRYVPLFEQVIEVASTDERIRALWLSGSLARGVSDTGSDLDLIATLRDEDFADFAAGWKSWLAKITPTLIARQLGAEFHGFYSTTTQFLRLDCVVEKTGDIGDSPHRYRLTVFDRDGLGAQVPAPADAPRPDQTKLDQLIEEFFRQSAIFPAAVIARQDWLLGAEGIHSVQLMLYQLFVETNQPLPPMGVKQWSAKLTTAQREVFTALPALERNRDSACAGMLAGYEAFRTAGRAAAEACGVTWPAELDRQVTAYLHPALVSPPSAAEPGPPRP